MDIEPSYDLVSLLYHPMTLHIGLRHCRPFWEKRVSSFQALSSLGYVNNSETPPLKRIKKSKSVYKKVIKTIAVYDPIPKMKEEFAIEFKSIKRSFTRSENFVVQTSIDTINYIYKDLYVVDPKAKRCVDSIQAALNKRTAEKSEEIETKKLHKVFDGQIVKLDREIESGELEVALGRIRHIEFILAINNGKYGITKGPRWKTRLEELTLKKKTVKEKQKAKDKNKKYEAPPLNAIQAKWTKEDWKKAGEGIKCLSGGSHG